jgi:small subunit ribosomal protein S21
VRSSYENEIHQRIAEIFSNGRGGERNIFPNRLDAYVFVLSIDAIIPITILRRNQMTQIILGVNEGIESALRRFKRQVIKADIFADMKKHRYFETPLQKSKRKAEAKHKRRKYKSSFRAR